MEQDETPMSKKVIVDNEFITLWCDPEAGIVSHEFHKPIAGSALRDALQAGLKEMRRVGATKWLSDDRKGHVLPEEDCVWGMESWYREVIAAGWKYWAIIPPNTPLGQLTAQRLIDDFGREGLRVKVFSAPHLAEQWLQNCEHDIFM